MFDTFPSDIDGPADSKKDYSGMCEVSWSITVVASCVGAIAKSGLNFVRSYFKVMFLPYVCLLNSEGAKPFVYLRELDLMGEPSFLKSLLKESSVCILVPMSSPSTVTG